MKTAIRFATFTAFVPLLLLTGCTNIKPWERGTLSDYTMRQERDPLSTAMSEHVWFSREATTGGRGVGGGGCGCN
ncbi:MAG: lipoprotein [Pedosphaera sp.]|nr:lipoprotein [Pedosphaera sp.]